MNIVSRLEREILVLDGAMGTMIMNESLGEKDFRGDRYKNHPINLKGCNDILSVTSPKIIEKIHTLYLNAGADIISTNTFNANSLSLAEYGLSSEVESICHSAVRAARNAINNFCEAEGIRENSGPFIAGSMGPTGVSLSIRIQEAPDPQAEFDMMADAYKEQASALIKAGVDLLLLETIFDTLNAKAAVYGIYKAFDETSKKVPLMISATVSENGRLLSGQTLAQFTEALAHAKPLSFGLNCGFGADALIPFLRNMKENPSLSNTFLSVHPNAGLPDEMGRYLDTPERMISEVKNILKDEMVNIIGGCCGTTPEHIRLISEIVKRYQPRQLSPVSKQNNHFIKVGERCNVAGSRKFLRLVAEKNWKECIDIAAAQVEKGAEVLDVNMDDGLLDTGACMTSFITRIYSDSRTSGMPLMVDSSDFDVIAQSIRLLPLKGIVNSISLKNGEEEFIRRAQEINRLGCAMVVMAFDETGQADTFERRIEICSRAYRLLVDRAGINPENIIFDPNVLAVATGISSHDSYAYDFIRSTDWIKKNLPYAKVSGGVSNLSFSFRGIDPVRKAMHTVFLEHNISKGMDMAIINPATPLEASSIEPELHSLVEDVILNRHPESASRLLDFAMRLKKDLDEKKSDKKNTVARHADLERKTLGSDLLKASLLDGDSSSLNKIIDATLEEFNGSAMEVVENVLMKGMDSVGEKFGAGEMFLPQVVRSASVMKNAIDILTPLIESQQNKTEDSKNGSRPLVVLATVKGDVHDIGKNIVAVVLRCGGFDVCDLGVMVEPETIIEKAIEMKAVAIGLSGLITPSLHEMGIVAQMMEEKDLKIPLFVGGATTSDLHTAVKIAPLYSGAVVHTSDAASLPKAVRDFTSLKSGEITERHKEYQQQLRETFDNRNLLLTLEEARTKRFIPARKSPTPLKTGELIFSIKLTELKDLINWRAFLSEWKLNPGDAPVLLKKISNKEVDDSEGYRLITEALALLDTLNGEAHGKITVLSARSQMDDIILGDGVVLPVIRSLIPGEKTGKTLALSDFISSKDDNIVLFAVTLAKSGVPERIEELKNKDEYYALLLQSLSHRLAEAATEWTHRKASQEIWGSDNRIGIRPAVGYSSLPDQSIVFILDKFLNYSSMDIQLTSNGALHPSATTTGFIIPNPEARYFDVGRITEEVRKDYILRRGISEEEASVFLK